ncbi:MAG TPA: hypothetical protein VNB90_05175 [Cytophagaceae bacterium]|nr:hypothetical protein [Cytophagaceae bacterium]
MKKFIYKEKIFIAAVILLHAVWWVISISIGNMHTGDSAEYEQQARNIREHGSLYAWYWNQPVDNDYHTWRPPVYGVFLFLCKSLYSSNYFFLFIQNLFSIGNCILLLYQCLKLPLHLNPRWWLLIGTALFPSWFMIANSISADTLFLFILMVAFTCLQEFLSSGRMSYFVVYNAALILALFTKPVLLYFWIPNLIFCIYLFKEKRKVALLILPLLFPMMAAAWCTRNYVVTGYWHFSSVSHINMVYYNSNYALMRKFGNEYADSVSTAILREAHSKVTYAEQVRYKQQRAQEIIRSYPLEYLYWHIKGSVLLFLEPGRSDWIHYFNTPPADNGSFSLALDENGFKGFWQYSRHFSVSMLLLLTVLGCWNLLLLFLCLKGFWRGRKIVYVQFLALFFLYITIVTGVVGCARYRLTLYPIMLLSACLAIQKRID